MVLNLPVFHASASISASFEQVLCGCKLTVEMRTHNFSVLLGQKYSV